MLWSELLTDGITLSRDALRCLIPNWAKIRNVYKTINTRVETAEIIYPRKRDAQAPKATPKREVDHSQPAGQAGKKQVTKREA